MGRLQAIPTEEGWFKVQYKQRQNKKYLWRAGQGRRYPHHLNTTGQPRKATRIGTLHQHSHTGKLHSSFLRRSSTQERWGSHQRNHSIYAKTQVKTLNGAGIAALGAVERLFVYGPVNRCINGYPGFNGNPHSKSTTKTEHLQHISSHPSPAINTPAKLSFIAMSKKRSPTTQQPPNLIHNPPPPINHANIHRQTFQPIHNSQLHTLQHAIPQPLPHPLPQPPQRYHAPPWQHFMDQNPWQFTDFQHDRFAYQIL